MSDVLKAAKRLAKQGFSVIWLRERSKAPVGRNWTKKPTMTLDELEDSYQEGCNVGVRLGKPSRIGKYYLCAIDVDIRDPEYRQVARERVEKLFDIDLRECPTVISGSGKGSFHIYALMEGPHRSRDLWQTEEKVEGADGKPHWCAEIAFFGTGKQVVLPPSIHPDTGNAYRWKEPFDADDLPILDENALSALLGDDGDEDGEGDKEPLNMTPEEVRDLLDFFPERREDRDLWTFTSMMVKHELGPRLGWEVIDDWSKGSEKYNRAENRKQFNSYKNSRVNGKILTIRTLLRMRKEADILDMLDEDDLLVSEEPEGITKREAIEIFDEIDASASTEEQIIERAMGKVPPHLLDMPGVLGKAVRHYNETCVQRQPQFAVHTALALGSVVLARHHKLDGIGVGNYTSLYLMILGETGSGKEFTRTFIRRILTEAELLGLMVPEGYGSAPGLFTELYHRPRHIFIEDEIGMKRATNMRSVDPNVEAVARKLTSIFGDLEGVVTPPSYSMRGKSKAAVEEERSLAVVRPAITTVGMSTPDVFFDNLSHAQVLDGFMNRILMVNSRIPKGTTLRQPDKPAPEELIEWVMDYGFTKEMWASHEDDFDDPLGLKLRESPTDVPPAKVYKKTDEAKRFELECEQEFLALYRKYQPLGLHHLFARSLEIMLRIALIVALSCRRKRVGKEHMQWAFDYVSFYTVQTAEDASKLIGSSPLVRVADQVLDQLSAAGPKGMATWEIAKKNYRFEKLGPREQEDVLARLTTNKNVRHVHIRPSRKGGRPATRYIHPEYDNE